MCTMDEEQSGRFLISAFRTLLEHSPDMVFVKDLNLVYWAASDTFARLVGHEKGEELIGKTDFDIFPPALAEKYTRDDRGILDNGICVEDYIEPLPEQNGKKNYSSTSKYVVRNERGEIVGLYGVARDATAEVALETEREQNRLSRQMFDSVLEADLTEDRMLRTEGSGWVERLGFLADTSFTGAVRFLAESLIHPDYAREFRERYDRKILMEDYRTGRDEFSHIIHLRTEGGSYRWAELRTRTYHSRVSDTLRVTTFIKDMDEDVRARQELQEKAVTDALTGLRNRENVLVSIAQCLADSDKTHAHALLFIDLDSFKQVNDRWGHRLGDKILQKTAERLQKLFRKDDILGRIGGDEFLVFLKDVPSRADAEERARRVVEMLPFRYCEQEKDVCITYSVGMAFCHGGEISVDQLCEQADQAMYRAKAQGRNRVFFYNDI